jgi:hypothetical protein
MLPKKMVDLEDYPNLQLRLLLDFKFNPKSDNSLEKEEIL